MINKECPECGELLLQMLSRDQRGRDGYGESIHYGFYCKKCRQMYREKWYLVKDGDSELGEKYE